MSAALARRRVVAVLALAVLLAAGLAFAPGAAAETYKVRLQDGGEFLSRYQPQESSWDPDTVLLISEVGNWVALDKADIESVTTETENQGFGKVIDTTTISLGFKPNDAPVPSDDAAEMSSIDRLRELLDRPPPDYTVDQFVEPGEAGRGGGLPVSGAGYLAPSGQ